MTTVYFIGLAQAYPINLQIASNNDTFKKGKLEIEANNENERQEKEGCTLSSDLVKSIFIRRHL